MPCVVYGCDLVWLCLVRFWCVVLVLFLVLVVCMVVAAGAGVWFAGLLVDWYLVGGIIGFAGILLVVVVCGFGVLVGIAWAGGFGLGVVCLHLGCGCDGVVWLFACLFWRFLGVTVGACVFVLLGFGSWFGWFLL